MRGKIKEDTPLFAGWFEGRRNASRLLWRVVLIK